MHTVAHANLLFISDGLQKFRMSINEAVARDGGSTHLHVKIFIRHHRYTFIRDRFNKVQALM